MFRGLAMGLVIVILGTLLAGAAYGSYAGYGIAAAGQNASARQGSIFGPSFLGGGPGSGK